MGNFGTQAWGTDQFGFLTSQPIPGIGINVAPPVNIPLGSTVSLGGYSGDMDGHAVSGSVTLIEEGYFEITLIIGTRHILFPIVSLSPSLLPSVEMLDFAFIDATQTLRQMYNSMNDLLPITYAKGRVVPAWKNAGVSIAAAVSKPVVLSIFSVSNLGTTDFSSTLLAASPGIWRSSVASFSRESKRVQAKVLFTTGLPFIEV